ncbi:MAG: hypothetical protein K6F87_08030 [Lachnospiraceae bacterium]|nr:hypothetical protein [Lachnospiraceae bacterium]
MTFNEYFESLKTKDIICWGSGKHFRNITCPFLCKSGLIENLKGFTGTRGKKTVEISGRSYDTFGKEELAGKDSDKTVILVAVNGYREILSQIGSDVRLAGFEVVPSVYLESLYEDMLLLSVNKPPMNYRKNDRPMIPKIIHAIWFSDDPMPELYKRCLKSWEKHASDYEIKIWNMETYKPDRCLFFEQATEAGNMAFASDYARADLLRRYGGIYMDLDVEMLRPIDDLLYNDAYMSFESLDRIECGSGMGAKPAHPIIQEICESYETRPYFKADGTWDNSTCPVRYTKVIEKHGLIKDGGFQQVEDITVYPFEVLTGKSFDTGIVYNTELSYTVHHHNGSWIPDHARQAMSERYADIQKFLGSRR